MLDVTVKTLDGRNRSFSVPDNISVKEFKEKIANSIEISADTQRLIFHGRVLQDDKELNSYDVNGKTLHVVQKPPPSAQGPNTANIDSEHRQPNTRPRGHHHGHNTVILGSYTLPSETVDPNQVQNMVQQAMSGMGGLADNARVSTRASADGSSVDVHINLGNIASPQLQSESQNRINQAQRMIGRASRLITRLENPNNTSTEGSPMDTGSPPSEPADTTSESTSAAAGTNTAAPSASPASSSSSAQQVTSDSASNAPNTNDSSSTSANSSSQTNGTTSQNTGTQTGPQHPNTTALGDLLQDVMEMNTRLQPFLERYQSLMAEDPEMEANSNDSRIAQRNCNLVSETMHCISHAYHNISDLMVDMNSARPRLLRSAPSLTPTAIIQQTIPVQAQINVSTTTGSPQTARRNPPSTATTSTTTASSQATSQPSSSSESSVGGNLPPGVTVAASSDPYVFVDVGPDAININSVSAHVVTSTETADTAANSNSTSFEAQAGSQQTPNPSQPSAPAGPPPAGVNIPGMPPGGIHIQGMPPGGMPGLPPNVMQNIIQMATNAAMQQGGTGGAPSAQVFMVGPNGQPVPVSLAASGAGPVPPPFTSSSSTTSRPATSTAHAFSPSVSLSGTFGPIPPPRHGMPRPTPAAQPSASSNQQGIGGMPQRPRASTIMFPGLPPRLFPPGMPGIMGGGPRPVDPYLNCNSRFFMANRVRNAAQAGSNRGAPTEPAGLANMVSSIVGSLVNSQNVNGAHIGQNTATSTSQAPQASGRVPLSSTAPHPAPGAGVEVPFINQLRTMLQQGQPIQPPQSTTSNVASPVTTSTTTAPSTASSAANQSAHVSDEVFAQLVSGIGSFVSQSAMGQQPSTSIADFLSTLGQNYNISQGEGLLTDIFTCVSRHLTFTDLMTVFFGIPEPLRNLRTPLQEFVRDRILKGDEPTTENVERAVDQLLEDIQPDIQQTCSDVTAREDILFEATLTEFARLNILSTIRLIINATDDTQFAQSLFQRIRAVIHEAVVLSRYCLEGGTPALERLMQGRVRSIASDINPMIQQWMAAMTSQQLHQIIPTITVTNDQVMHYVVRRVAAEQASEQQPMEASPAPVCSQETGDKAAQSEKVLKTPTSPSHSQSSEGSFMSADEGEAPVKKEEAQVMEIDSEEAEVTRPRIPPSILATLPPPPNTVGEREVPVRFGSEDWHGAVPPDWVPIISRDIQRQRRPQAPQMPFSDAYVNGMPAKRRKRMSEFQTSTDASRILPEAARQAATVTRSRPLTSVDSLSADLQNDQVLHDAFQREIDQNIQERLASDPDYVPEKYKNVDKYFKKE